MTKQDIINHTITLNQSINWVQAQIEETCQKIDINNTKDFSMEKEENAEFLNNRLRYLISKAAFERKSIEKLKAFTEV